MTRPFSVVAIIAARNEADIIEHVVRDLIAQGIDIYYIDDDSTDGTREIVERYVGHGVIGIEGFDGTPGRFEWERLLRRKEALAQSLEADWFIHHDADEFRESPWPDVSLKQAIGQADAVGCNAIDFCLFEFRPDHDDFVPGTDVRQSLTSYAPPAFYDLIQIRCWKKQPGPVDLAESGGHQARFPGRRVFPVQFILRHYPVRSQAHGTRKVFEGRLPRFSPAEQAKGWHVQYNAMTAESSFVVSRDALTVFEPREARRQLAGSVETLCDLELRVADLQEALDAALAESERHRQRWSEAADEARRATVRVTELESRLRHHEAQSARVDALAAAIAEQQIAIDHYRRRAMDFEQSLSWRLTAPARAAYRLLTGHR